MYINIYNHIHIETYKKKQMHIKVHARA